MVEIRYGDEYLVTGVLEFRGDKYFVSRFEIPLDYITSFNLITNPAVVNIDKNFHFNFREGVEIK